MLSFRRLLPLILLPVCAAAVGCTTVSTADDPHLLESFQQRTPQSIAVAPFLNETDVDNAGEFMREAVYGELAPLGYEDVDLEKVDALISKIAVENDIRPENVIETMPEALLEPDLADAVIFGSVTRISRLYLLFYAQHRVDVDLIMRDAETGDPLYMNSYIIQNRLVQFPTGIPSLIGSLFTSLWYMRPKELRETLEVAAEQISTRFPRPYQLAGSGSTFIHRAEVGLPPRETLLLGDRIAVRVEGTPERSGSFSIGKIVDDAPLIEVSPGQYSGGYVVQPGDEVGFTFVTVQLEDPGKPREDVNFPIHQDSFAIDAVPPPPFRVVRWGQDPNAPGVFLEFGPANPETAPEEKPVSFFIFRSPAGAEDLDYIGSSTVPYFHDETARPGVTYQYGIVAIDEANNHSPLPSTLDRITPRPRATTQ